MKIEAIHNQSFGARMAESIQMENLPTELKYVGKFGYLLSGFTQLAERGEVPKDSQVLKLVTAFLKEHAGNVAEIMCVKILEGYINSPAKTTEP